MNLRRLPLLLALALTALLALTATALAQDTTTTAPAPTPGIALAGSTVAGVDISGQDAATALITVTNAFNQPIVVRIGARVFKISNEQIAATADVQAAVTEAVNRTAAGNTPVTTAYNETKLQAAVDRILKMASTKGSAARWQLTRTKPVLKLGRPGNAPDRAVVVEQVKRASAVFSFRAQQDVVRHGRQRRVLQHHGGRRRRRRSRRRRGRRGRRHPSGESTTRHVAGRGFELEVCSKAPQAAADEARGCAIERR